MTDNCKITLQKNSWAEKIEITATKGRPVKKCTKFHLQRKIERRKCFKMNTKVLETE